jgi:DNA-binding beta-propeller fold protein YncE
MRPVVFHFVSKAQNWSTGRTISLLKILNSLIFVILFGALLGACNASPSVPREWHVLPDNPIVLDTGDCVWIVDADTDSVIGPPMCLSGLLEQIWIGDVQTAPNGHLYISAYKTVEFDLTAGKVVFVVDPAARKVEEIEVPLMPRCIAIGDKAAYVSRNGGITVIDLETKEVIDQIELDLPCYLEEMVLDPTGMLYVSACDSIAAVDTTTNSVSLERLRRGRDIYDIAVAPDGNLYILYMDSINIVDPTNWEIVSNVELGQCKAFDIAVTEAGKVYVVCRDGPVMEFDATENKLTSSIQLSGRSFQVVGTHNQKVFLVDKRDEKIVVIDGASDEITEILLPQ